MTLTTTSAQRLETLRSLISDGLRAIQQAAVVFAEMEHAGDDTSMVPPHLRASLRAIHAQTLLPEVYATMTGSLRAAVATLPISEQRRLIEADATVELVLPGGDQILTSPQRLTAAQVRQVFGNGYIRARAEQLAVIAKPDVAKRGYRGRTPGVPSITLNKQDGVVDYYGHKISKATLLKWLSEL
jgi:hypothetical protein